MNRNLLNVADLVQSRVDSSSLKFEGNEFVTTDELARELRVSPATIRNMASNGQIPFCKLGRRNRYPLAEIKMRLLATKREGSL